MANIQNYKDDTLLLTPTCEHSSNMWIAFNAQERITGNSIAIELYGSYYIDSIIPVFKLQRVLKKHFGKKYKNIQLVSVQVLNSK